MKQIHGIPAAPGIAIGPVFHYRPVKLAIEKYAISDTAAEWVRLEAALGAAATQLEAIYDKAVQETGAQNAEIFQAQSEMLRDPELLELCRQELEGRLVNVEAAWLVASEHFAQELEVMQNEYFRARAADVRDVANRVLRLLAGAEDQAAAALSVPSIVIANDLTPSDTILLDKTYILGFCTATGGETSHTAILARSLGLPAIVGAGEAILSLPAAGQAILDGSGGDLWVDPDAQTVADWQGEARLRQELHAAAFSLCHEPAVTRDGVRVEVVANIGGVSGARNAIEQGAEGVGLLRTEFLFLERSSLPDEEEQYQAYCAILDVFGELPVVLRTIDIGGDKDIPYMNLKLESNPFLGVRGLRLCLARPELFKTQLRAALRAAPGHNLKIMFPMVATLGEVRQARRLVDECLAELRGEGRPLAAKVEIGIMVEIPSAALLADRIAPAVDFFSIGTNDLTQYTLAVDRTNAGLSYLTSAFSPAVLGLIGQVIQAGHRRGRWVGVCGELAGEPLAIPILLGLGLDEFSMNPPAVPLAKQIIRLLSLPACRELAQAALLLENAQEVKELVGKRMGWIKPV